MIDRSPEWIAANAGAEIAVRGAEGYPERAVIDSRRVRRGDLFVGLRGAHLDGGRFAADALSAGAWGALVSPEHGADLARGLGGHGQAWVLTSPDPLASLQSLARAWRRQIDCPLVGITGSTGKTSVKDIAKAILPRRVHASPDNFNTEIGLPLALLAAPRDTEVLVMEMAMRGRGQIAELCRIAEPDVVAITNIGPVHLELLGTIEAVAEAKAEILTGLEYREGVGRAVVPTAAEALRPHLHDELLRFSFGPGGQVNAESVTHADGSTRALIETPHGSAEFELPFTEAYNLTNALCAVAIGIALDLEPAAMAERTSRISFSRLRGEHVALAGGITLLNDCYNANPTSMRAAIENLATFENAGRRLAVLGGMGELGPDGRSYHEEVASLARERGIEPLIGVGELARGYSPDQWFPGPREAAEALASELVEGDVLLVKGSRAVGLEQVADELRITIGEEPGS